MSVSVGLVGARGHVGREMLRLLAQHPHCALAYASSREWAGRPVADMAAEVAGDLAFEALSPQDCAARRADVVVLGLPNGLAAPFVEALNAAKPDTLIIDLSADHRHQSGWVYGLPEAERAGIAGARRIANPGCYATAAQLALTPLTPHLDGPASVFGVSGYSGAGTTPSRKNDPAALRDNLIPYGLVDHGHEREIAAGAGWDVRFMPMVASFFRGLVVTVSASVRPSVTADALRAALDDAYGDEPFVQVQDAPAEPAAVAERADCVIGGVVVNAAGKRMVVTAALDNLLKGAASQALQNLNLAMGLEESLGLSRTRVREEATS